MASLCLCVTVKQYDVYFSGFLSRLWLPGYHHCALYLFICDVFMLQISTMIKSSSYFCLFSSASQYGTFCANWSWVHRQWTDSWLSDFLYTNLKAISWRMIIKNKLCRYLKSSQIKVLYIYIYIKHILITWRIMFHNLPLWKTASLLRETQWWQQRQAEHKQHYQQYVSSMTKLY